MRVQKRKESKRKRKGGREAEGKLMKVVIAFFILLFVAGFILGLMSPHFFQ